MQHTHIRTQSNTHQSAAVHTKPWVRKEVKQAAREQQKEAASHLPRQESSAEAPRQSHTHPSEFSPPLSLTPPLSHSVSASLTPLSHCYAESDILTAGTLRSQHLIILAVGGGVEVGECGGVVVI